MSTNILASSILENLVLLRKKLFSIFVYLAFCYCYTCGSNFIDVIMAKAQPSLPQQFFMALHSHFSFGVALSMFMHHGRVVLGM